MRKPFTLLYGIAISILLSLCSQPGSAQTPAFPDAGGFGRFATGARGVSNPTVYIVTNLNDSGTGSFRDAVSQPGRFVVFAVGGIINLKSVVAVAKNTTIAAQTAPGDGIVLFNKTVSFSNSSNTIARYLRIRLGATDNAGKDASGIASGANIILDHLSVTWGMDEVFSINWDNKGPMPDNITIQNSIIGQGLHRQNHSAGGLIQTPDGGRVSLLKNLYISNKTRNPKVKGVNEFVNNVVYNWGNGNRLGDEMNYGWTGDAYIMGGDSQGVSEVNIINNYFVGGPNTPPGKTTPFSRGSGNFYLYGAGNYFDNNQNGQLDGALVPVNITGYPGITDDGFKSQPFAYPTAVPQYSAAAAYQQVIDQAGATYPRRDQVDQLMIDEVKSRGTAGLYVYRETDLPLSNGGLGNVFSAQAPPDTDQDGIPDAWEDANGLNKNNPADALLMNTDHPGYLNIEVYINGLASTAAPDFIRPPSNVSLTATSAESPVPASMVTIKWLDNSENEQSFVLERSTNNTNYSLIATVNANVISYTDQQNLIPNTTYYYRIKATHATDQSAYSAVASIKTPPIPTAPAIPVIAYPATGFQYAELINSAVTLKWTGSSNTSTFAVYFGTDPQALVKKADVAYSAAPSFLVNGLTEGNTYYWRIDASNAKGLSPGETWTFRTSKTIPKGIIGYWSFDDTEGIQVSDSTSYENHGVLGLDDDNANIRTAGKKKNALDFSTADVSSYVVSIPHEDQLYLDKNSFTLSFWMKANPTMLPQDNNSSAYLLCKGSITKNAATRATGKRFDIEFKNKQFRFAIDDDNDANGGGKDELQATATSFFNNEWVYVTVIRDVENKKLKLYQNGILFKESDITKANAGIGESSALIIGNIGEYEFLSTTNQSAPYRGMLDELKMFNYALSDTEIMTEFYTDPHPMQAYNPSPATATTAAQSDQVILGWTAGLKTTSFEVYLGSTAEQMTLKGSTTVDKPFLTVENLSINSPYFWRVDAIGPGGKTSGSIWNFRTAKFKKGLTGHWMLDEKTGQLAADSSRYANHGSLQNFTAYQWSDDARFKGSLLFSNPLANGAISIPDAGQIRFDQGSFSISMWVKIAAATSPDCYLLQKGTFEATTGKWYGLQLKSNLLTFAIDDGINKSNLDVTINKAPYNILAQGWKHLVAVRDASSNLLKIYIDGVLAGSKTSATTTGTIGQSKALLLGNSTENKPYKEAMDDVRIYNYALAAEEITNLFNGATLVKQVQNVSPLNQSINLSPQQTDFSWTGDAERYAFYVGTHADSLMLQQNDIQTKYFSLQNLKPLSTYYWRVDALNDGETAKGTVWSFQTAYVNQAPTLNEIPTQTLCQAAETKTISLSGITAGPESSQSISIDAIASTGQFDLLTAELNANGTALVKYRLKPEVSGLVEFNVIVTDNGGTEFGGINKISQKVNLQVAALPNLQIASNKPLNIGLGQSITLTASGGSNYTWQRPFLYFGNLNTPSITVYPLVNTTYKVAGTNSSGCATEKEVKVTVSSLIRPRNILTPNGDGNNDLFVIENIELYPNNEVKIVDRLGKLVYSKKGYTNDWNGYYNGKPLPEGTYYYTIRYGYDIPMIGFITIIRER